LAKSGRITSNQTPDYTDIEAAKLWKPAHFPCSAWLQPSPTDLKRDSGQVSAV